MAGATIINIAILRSPAAVMTVVGPGARNHA
jgi:hypothetical protein